MIHGARHGVSRDSTGEWRRGIEWSRLSLAVPPMMSLYLIIDFLPSVEAPARCLGESVVRLEASPNKAAMLRRCLLAHDQR